MGDEVQDHKIDITPEMTEAGGAILRDEIGFPDDRPGQMSEEELAAEVFKAMLAVFCARAR